MDTHTLIDALVADLIPVRRLFPPTLRLLGWLAVSIPAVATVVALQGVRSDLAMRFAEPTFLAEQAATVATALVAGWAALAGCIPGTARWKLWAPVAPLCAWMVSLGHQCWSDWVRVGTAGMMLGIPVISMQITTVARSRRDKGWRTAPNTLFIEIR